MLDLQQTVTYSLQQVMTFTAIAELLLAIPPRLHPETGGL